MIPVGSKDAEETVEAVFSLYIFRIALTASLLLNQCSGVDVKGLYPVVISPFLITHNSPPDVYAITVITVNVITVNVITAITVDVITVITTNVITVEGITVITVDVITVDVITVITVDVISVITHTDPVL